MSNFTEQKDKIAVYLQELYDKHRALDTHIFDRYNQRASNQELVRLKTKKLWIKDEIHRLESELQSLKSN